MATVRPTGTEFSTRYSEAGGIGDLVVSVQSGVAEVSTRRGQLTTLTAGMQATFEDSVPRVTPILPVDGGGVVGGRVNTFSWTAFGGAASYLFEYTLSPSGFARANPSTVESARDTLRVTPGLFTETGGTVEFPLAVPAGVAPAGTRAQWRIFPADAAGQILPSTTASDASTVVLE